VNKGGHFAAWEDPELFTEELRAAFKPLRQREHEPARASCGFGLNDLSGCDPRGAEIQIDVTDDRRQPQPSADSLIRLHASSIPLWLR
jgi:hypothetical protein